MFEQFTLQVYGCFLMTVCQTCFAGVCSVKAVDLSVNRLRRETSPFCRLPCPSDVLTKRFFFLSTYNVLISHSRTVPYTSYRLNYSDVLSNCRQRQNRDIHRFCIFYTLSVEGEKKKIALIEQTEGDIFIGKVVACRNLIRRVRACKLAKLGQLY